MVQLALAISHSFAVTGPTALLRLLAAVLDFINKHDGWPFDG